MRVIWEQADLPEAEIIVRGRLDDKKTAELLVTLQSLAGADKETGHRIFLYRDGREFLCETASIWFFETQNGKYTPEDLRKKRERPDISCTNWQNCWNPTVLSRSIREP